MITENYCTENKSKQSLWAVDTARSKYIIRVKILPETNKKKKKNKWKFDENAMIVKTLMIQPLLKYLTTLAIKEMEKLSQKNMEKEKIDELMK